MDRAKKILATLDRRCGLAFMMAALGMMLTGCSAVDVLNATAPRVGLAISRNIAYGKAPRQSLDVYSPAAATNAPVVVFLYGGGWTEGEKDQYAFVATALASRGIVTIVPDYRLYPQVRFPTFIEDAALAVRWAHDHASAYGGDPRRLVLVGHSAGAYIAAMLTLDRHWLNTVGLDPESDLAGSVGLAGPYDFLPLGTDELRAIFGPENTLAQTQPINFVDGRNPPMLLITGDSDNIVYPRNTIHLAHKIRSQGGQARTIFYRRVSHEILVGAFAWPLRFLAPVLNDTTDFVRGLPAVTGIESSAPSRLQAGNRS